MSRIAAAALAAAVVLTGAASAEAKSEMVANRDARAMTRPSKKAKRAFRLHRDDVVVVLAERGAWTQVQTQDGKRGWVRTSALEQMLVLDELDGDVAAAGDDDDLVLDRDALAPDADDGDEQQVRERLDAPGLAIDLGAAIGASSYARDFSSNGDGPLGGYELSVSSVTAAVDASAHYGGGGWFVDAAARYIGSAAAPGVRYEGVDGMSAANQLVTHALAGEVSVGVIAGAETRIAAGAGYRLDYFVVDEIQDNPGLLARERLGGPTASLSLQTGFGPRMTLGLRFDALIAGDLSQTANLEDGTSSEVSGYGGGFELRYALGPALSLGGTYRGRKLSYSFAGQSRRQFDVTSASRTDATHTVVIGAVRSF